VRDAFFPDGLVMGSGATTPPRPRRPAEGGTPEQVLAAMRSLCSCCTSLATRELTCETLWSRAVLGVKGNKAPVSAQELLNLSPTTTLPVGAVTLAGCTVNVSGAEYDEALSLSSDDARCGPERTHSYNKPKTWSWDSATEPTDSASSIRDQAGQFPTRSTQSSPTPASRS